LSGVEVPVPTLRSRPDDVVELARHFLSRHRDGVHLELSEAAADALRLYEWPGNVRELERVIERAVTLTSTGRIELQDLPAAVGGDYHDVFKPSTESGESMRAWGSRYARVIFERCGRNKSKTCRVLGISYHTLEAYLRYKQEPRHGARAMPAWASTSSSGEEAGNGHK
jgi:DNA-binding NtrC family response regulator